MNGSHDILIHLCIFRYSDFMVHEVDQNGCMVMLNDFSVPPDEEDEEDVRLLMNGE